MLPRNHPDRIHVAFDDHRLVANAGLILPATLAQHLGLPQLVDRHLDLGRAPRPSQSWRQDIDPGGLRPGRGRLHRRRRHVARWRNCPGSGLCGQGAIHPRFREGRLWGRSCAASVGATSVSWTG